MTAVQYLVDQVEQYIGLIPVDVIEKALEMERQEIIDAHGIKTISINQDQAELITGDQYYNETYK